MHIGTPGYSRREVLRLLGASTVSMLGCTRLGGAASDDSARLTTRPGTPSQQLTPGLRTLGLDSTHHDARLLIPTSYVAGTPTPFVLALHGAGGSAAGPIGRLSPYAESNGFILLAVDSYGSTWDAIRGSYGSDVRFIDRALRYVFDRCSVDPARLVIEGFSDGASYALGLGLVNGDLFRRIVAFSPGFIPPSNTSRHGTAEIWISHGVQDPILPVDSTSRQIVPALRGAGYAVTYVEFTGGHEVPDSMATQAGQWLVR
jgi:predicted esterase